jgi:hypothetical protein
MNKRYSILVRENGSNRESELCQVDSNAEKIAEAAGMKLLRISSAGRRYRIKRYDWIRIVDNGEASTVPHSRAEEPPENAAMKENLMNDLAQYKNDYMPQLKVLSISSKVPC